MNRPALHRRGAVRVRRDGQHRPLRQHAAARAVRPAASPAASGRRSTPVDAVVLRQPLVQERVVAVEQLQQAAVVPHDVLEEHLGLAPHGPAEVAVQLELARTGGTRRRTTSRSSSSSFFSASVRSSGGLRISSRNRARCCSAFGVGRLVAGDHGAGVDQDARRLSRAWSHWPTKCRTNSLDSRVGEHPLDLRRSGSPAACPRRPGGTARRRASTTRGSTTAATPGRTRRRAGACRSEPASTPSSRNRNRGDARTTVIAWATPASNVRPARRRWLSASFDEPVDASRRPPGGGRPASRTPSAARGRTRGAPPASSGTAPGKNRS